MTKTATIDFKFGGRRYRIQGAKWFYNDADIRSKTGAELTSEADLAEGADDLKHVYQRRLVRMAMTLSTNLPGVNAAQTKTKRRYFWCRPDKVATAMTGLLNKTIDASLFPGNYRITKVEMPVGSNIR
jgi:hypothetical protein